MEKYPEIEKIHKDIKDLNIQGATNVCIATFEGMKRYIELSDEKDKSLFYKEFFEVGETLSLARENEPLARNGVKYVRYFFEKEHSDLPELESMKRELRSFSEEYLEILESSKKLLIEKSVRFLTNFDKVFTHCHSSTVVSLLVAMSKGDSDFEVVCTETRPLFQGRTTAKNLLNAGIKTTMIADSAGESFIINRGSVPIDAVFIGCDQITAKGHTINKIGSWGMGVASHYAGKPFYVVTPLLKVDPNTFHNDVKIEVREDSELWKDAPRDLHMYNPAFEIVDSQLITGYICEFGIVKPSDVDKVVSEAYPWLL